MQIAEVVDFQTARRMSSRPIRDPEGYSDRHFNDVAELTRFLADEIRASRMRYSKLASISNVHATTISKLAHGQVQFPRAATLLQILRALGFEIIVRG